MTQSFGFVEEKVLEADFFLTRLRSVERLAVDARFYFSAFVSASRTVTLSLQVTMSGVPGFATWYEAAQRKLKLDPLARHFVELRNDEIHKGRSALNRATPEHLRDILLHQLAGTAPPHYILLPDPQNDGATTMLDAVEAGSQYLRALVRLIFDCYAQFKEVVDPQWYFTQHNFEGMGKTLADALSELGFPTTWSDTAPSGLDGAWRSIRRQQPPCALNQLFAAYLGERIAGPDD